MPNFASVCHMGGYACYVWSAYGVVFFTLLLQWLLARRQWRQLNQSHPSGVVYQKHTHDITSST